MLKGFRSRSQRKFSIANAPHECRLLRFESLEDRRLLDGAGASDAIELFSTSTALFVENQGQWQDEAVRYGFDGPGVNIAFAEAGLSFLLTEQEKIETDTSDSHADDRFDDPDDFITHSTQFSVQFDGANHVTPVGLDQSESRFNYYVGDTTNHRSNVPGYTTVAYHGLYEGINLHTFGRRNSLKYEFYVAPGADYRQIEVSYDGIEGLWIDEAGALHIETELGQLVDDAPFTYQMIDGQQVEVASQFSLVDADTYTFVVTGTYDPSVELVVDPNLDWGSYLGGSGIDEGYGIAVDGSGNALVTGSTSSSGWVSGGWDTSLGGTGDAFVVKLSNSGAHLWSSYLGGSSSDSGRSITVDGGGNILVTGATESSDWVSGGWDTSHGGFDDGFVVKLSGSGSYLWSSYLGGSHNDYGRGIAVDENGNALVTGRTQSSGWVSGGWDTSHNFFFDGFVVKLSSSGSHLWSSYLGGSSYDEGRSIAIDSSGNALVAGETRSAGWVSGGWDTSRGGSGDGFVVKFSGSGSHLWSSYLGGSSYDEGHGIAIDGNDNLLVTGETQSTSWVSGGWDISFESPKDAFVVKLSDSGSHLWSSYLGSSGSHIGYGIVVDQNGNALVTGSTDSLSWASGGWDTSYGGSTDGFVAKIEGSGTPAGDFNSDYDVDDDDLQAWEVGFGTTSGASLEHGDSNSDGDVDGFDFLIWQQNFGTDLSQTPTADFNSDTDVDGSDFLAWQHGFGTPAPAAARLDGDADFDLDVDADDLATWESQFGTVAAPAVPALALTSKPVLLESPLSADLVDVAIEMDLDLRSKASPQAAKSTPQDEVYIEWLSHSSWEHQFEALSLNKLAAFGHGHSSNVAAGNSNHDADHQAANAELLEKLFAEDVLGSL